MTYEKATVRRARVAREWREQREQGDRARIAADCLVRWRYRCRGSIDRMAQALLDYRHLLRQFIDAGEMIRDGKPFIVIGPGPHWTPDPRKQWP